MLGGLRFHIMHHWMDQEWLLRQRAYTFNGYCDSKEASSNIFLWVYQYDLGFFPFHFFAIWHQSHSCLVIWQILFRNGYQINLLHFASFMHLDIFVIIFSCAVLASYCLFLETEIRGGLSVLFESLNLLSALGFKSFLLFCLHTKTWNISTNLILSKLISCMIGWSHHCKY